MRSRERTASWELTPRQLCDLELIASGAFAPLETFLGRKDYESVCDRMRLQSGALWPVPVTLDLPEETLAAAPPGPARSCCSTRSSVSWP